ncbi:MAG: DUF2203 family protein [Planctomycetota bacterium]|jgi:hypothetical protein
MDARLFTLDEANRMLPLVKSIVQDAVRQYRLAKEGIRAWERLRAQRKAGQPVGQEELDHRDRVIAGHLEALEGLNEELEGLGCRLRDFERGVVDFPAATVDDGGFVYFCWALGETRVAHYHSESEGFRDRRFVGAGSSPG